MTPRELVLLFGAAPDKGGEELDALSELRRVNHEVLRGRSPVVPPWLMKEVPRAARD